MAYAGAAPTPPSIAGSQKQLLLTGKPRNAVTGRPAVHLLVLDQQRAIQESILETGENRRCAKRNTFQFWYMGAIPGPGAKIPSQLAVSQESQRVGGRQNLRVLGTCRFWLAHHLFKKRAVMNHGLAQIFGAGLSLCLTDRRGMGPSVIIENQRMVRRDVG
jgi:hypothetical protein